MATVLSGGKWVKGKLNGTYSIYEKDMVAISQGIMSILKTS